MMPETRGVIHVFCPYCRCRKFRVDLTAFKKGIRRVICDDCNEIIQEEKIPAPEDVQKKYVGEGG
jgi:hypothetical protein